MALRRRALLLGTLGGLTAGVLGAVAFLSLRDSAEEPDLPRSTPTTTSAAGALAPDDPRPIAQAFLVAWSRSDWVALDALVTDLSASENHRAWRSGLEATNVDLLLSEVTLLSEGRAFATFDVSVEVAGEGVWSYPSQLTLIWDGAGWIVDWFPDILHPLLTSGDRFEIVRQWPDRAPILGSDGAALVTTLPSVTAGVIPNRVESRAEVRAAFATYVGVEPGHVDAVMDAPNVQPDWFLSIAVIPREEYPDVRPALYPVPGIAFRVAEGRAPVESGLALHVLGTTGEITAELLDDLGDPYGVGDIVGRTPSSLERTHEHRLAGTPTLDIVKVSAGGAHEVLHSFPGEPAAALSTTLSLPVQRAAEAAVNSVETAAALVAIDVATGEIRAVVSRPLEGFNRAVTGLYPPGSTFKLVVTLAALESGFTPDSSLDCPEEVDVAGQTFHNAVSLPRSLTLAQALIRSCNTAFIQLAGTLEQSAIEAAAGRLGFNVDYTIGLGTPGGSYPTPASTTEAAAAAIGQANVLATPVHMASVAAALASGAWKPPTLIARGDIEPVDPIDPEIAGTIRSLMIDVVEDRNGTGSNARVEGLTVGGKTGTAQLGSEEDDPLVAWFVGFSDDIAFAVMVENGESGGRSAAPMAAAFLEFLIQTENSGGAEGCVDPAGGWSTFQGGNARTGCVVGVAAVTDPAVRWSAEIGIQAWLNNPIIVDDLVIVGTAGSSRGRADSTDGIVAVRLSDGAVEWRVGAAVDVNGVAVGEGIVVATGDEGKVWGLRVDNGRTIWEFDAGTLVFSSPLIVDGLAVVGDAAGILRALDLEDGTELWSVFLAGAIRGGAASDGRLIYAASDSGEVVAVNLAGEIIWEKVVQASADALGGVRILGAPTVIGESVVFPVIEDGTFSGPAVVAFDKFVGTERWRGADVIGADWSSVTNSVSVYGSQVVFASSLTTGVQAVDAASGLAVWATETPVHCDRQWASTIVVGDTILAPRTDGTLYAIDGQTHDVVWKLAVTANEGSGAGVDCTSDESTVEAIQLQATPAIAPDGTIIIGTLGGWLYAIEQRSE